MTYLRNQNLVTRLYARRDPLSLLVNGTGSNGQDLCLVELGEEDAGCGLGFGLEALDEDAVEERGNGLD
jgi:hypothetical protein